MNIEKIAMEKLADRVGRRSRKYNDETEGLSEKTLENLVLGGGLAATAGGVQLKKNFDSGKLDGIERLHHNTMAENVSSILRDGLKSSFADDPNNLTNTALGDRVSKDQISGKVYLARKKAVANGVGWARYQHKTGNPVVSPQGVAPGSQNIKIKIPTEFLKKTDNPELLGAKSQKEFVKKLAEKTGFPELMLRLQALGAYEMLGPNGTVVHAGDIPPEYIRGGAGYSDDVFKGVAKRHILNNPKAVALGLTPLITIGGGGGIALAALKKRMELDQDK